jgi:hypothetical protein
MDNPTTSKPIRIPDHLQEWITARKRHRLSHAHVHMARELGMNPAGGVSAEGVLSLEPASRVPT